AHAEDSLAKVGTCYAKRPTDSSEEGFDELGGDEGTQVVDALPHPDEPEWHRAGSRNGCNHAALGGAVELRQDEPAQSQRGVEGRHLGERVLSGVRVEHEQ